MGLDLFYDEKKMYLFLKKYCETRKFINALRSLDYAAMHHEGQKRKGNGAPYITHPMSVAFFMILCGMSTDKAISLALLHDVPEDCGTDLSDLNVEEEIKHDAFLLNWKRYKYSYSDINMAMFYYYINIARSMLATLVKMGDRLHNLSTMAGAFTKEKMIDYIKETKTYFPILFEYGYLNFPEVKLSIQFLQQRIEGLIEAYEENDFSNPETNFDQKVIEIFQQKVYVPDKKIIVFPKEQDQIRKRIIVS